MKHTPLLHSLKQNGFSDAQIAKDEKSDGKRELEIEELEQIDTPLVQGG